MKQCGSVSVCSAAIKTCPGARRQSGADLQFACQLGQLNEVDLFKAQIMEQLTKLISTRGHSLVLLDLFSHFDS